MERPSKKILIMSGGTGGHIFPALAIADEMQQQHCQIVWLGTKKGMESRLIPAKNYPIEYIEIGGLRGKGLATLFTMPYRIIKALIQTFAVFQRIKPDLVIGMGGFVTGPGGLISWILAKPLVIHEQNAISGLSNNILSLIAKLRLCAFPGAYKGFFLAQWLKTKKCIVTGNPIRKDILALSRINKTIKHDNKLNILVIGGSLGAQKINQIVPQAMRLIQQEVATVVADSYVQYHIIHQCGKGKVAEVEHIISEHFFDNEIYGIQMNYQLEEFIADMAKVYQWADIIICRSGALTISEITVVGLSAILIPLPTAVGDHQTQNAKYISDNKAGFLLAQADLNAESLKQVILQCDSNKLADMSRRAKKLAKPNATSDVVKHCLSLIDNSNGIQK